VGRTFTTGILHGSYVFFCNFPIEGSTNSRQADHKSSFEMYTKQNFPILFWTYDKRPRTIRLEGLEKEFN